MNTFIKHLEGIGAFILSGAVLNCIKEEAGAYCLLFVFVLFAIGLLLKERTK